VAVLEEESAARQPERHLDVHPAQRRQVERPQIDPQAVARGAAVVEVVDQEPERSASARLQPAPGPKDAAASRVADLEARVVSRGQVQRQLERQV
jgi:hypothetical protein